MQQMGEWGGSEPNRYKYDINKHGANKDDLKKATSYEKEKYGKRDFKHGSPLHPGKGATLVKSEILKSIKAQLQSRDFSKTSILNEDAIIDEFKE